MKQIIYTGQEIANIIGAKLISDNPSDIKAVDILIDSRRLIGAKHTLFFALVTKKNDGHRYIRELYEKGIRYFVVNKPPKSFEGYKKCSFFIVNDTLEALQMLSAFHRSRFDIPVIGITGSNGKTVIKEWLFQLIKS